MKLKAKSSKLPEFSSILEDGEKCHFCNDISIEKYIYTIQLKDGTYLGYYCSLDCTESDSYVPRFRDSFVVKLKK